ncbi:MAG TPA: hypothetical protein DDW73_17560 [Rhizobium sp.]|nr:hypothetical protein [Rhizobium sp.]
MSSLFNAPTLFLCLLAGWGLVATLLTASWLLERRSQQLAYWSCGLWCISFGCLLQAVRGLLPNGLGSGVGLSIVFIGVGFIWLGFRVFDGFPKSYIVAFGFSGAWTLFFFGVGGVSTEPNVRVAVYTVLLVSQVALIIHSIWSGWKRERLPARLFIMAMLICYDTITFLRLPLSLLAPVNDVAGVYQTAWFGPLLFILYVNGLGIGIGIFSLSYERSLRQYKRVSEIDSLTGVFNRRAFNELVESRIVAKGGVVALMDIDHFKRVNDSYGHAAGDLVLCRFTGIVTQYLTEGMIFGRTGGEEFTLFVPSERCGDVAALCEQLRRVVADTPIVWRDAVIHLTVSIGIREASQAGEELDAVLLGADAALYAAKDRGRNMVVVGVSQCIGGHHGSPIGGFAPVTA